MQAILGIDAAWTEHEPSGVALIQGEDENWNVLCMAPSYDSFVACSQGASVDWNTPRFSGSYPNVTQLVNAARNMAAADISVVALDIPIANAEFDSRRAADSAISKEFGSRGCAAHSPNAVRPGPLAQSITSQLNDEGVRLATTTEPQPDGLCAIEVYTHPALLALLGSDYRVPYKVSKCLKYWPRTSKKERITKLLIEFEKIKFALVKIFRSVPIELPHPRETETLAALKRYEDALDALVCAWVGMHFAHGLATPYGDDSAAIWVPKSGSPTCR